MSMCQPNLVSFTWSIRAWAFSISRNYVGRGSRSFSILLSSAFIFQLYPLQDGRVTGIKVFLGNSEPKMRLKDLANRNDIFSFLVIEKKKAALIV